jgi:hypothetical protein
VDLPALLLIAIALSTAVGYAVVGIQEALRCREARRPPSPEQSMTKLRADLRRLHDQLDAIEIADVPGKYLRCEAVRRAYVDALTTGCRLVGVAPPAASGSGRVRQAEIYRVEAELRGYGLDVRGARTA